MRDRSILGPADVADDVLEGMVARLLGAEHAEVLESSAEEVAYDIPAITTAGRYWVRGSARVDGEVAPFGFFVKHVQSWSRSPFFAFVPEEWRERAEAAVPWRTEPLAYRSDLGDHLPDGLALARALGVFDLDELSAAVWLEEVPVAPVTWDLDRYVEAAGLLGRLAASPAVAPYAAVGGHEWTLREYVEGRLEAQILPVLRSEEVWQHPLVAATFEPSLRERLLRAADRARALAEELASLPVLTGHGDASPNNLLVRADRPGFTLIDFGFWNRLPVGFDLGQLLVGDVQIGRRGADDLAARGEACLRAYVEGLRSEGFPAELPDVRRAHALHLMIFSGLSTLPFDLLDAEPTAELRALAACRAAIARHALDLLEATG